VSGLTGRQYHGAATKRECAEGTRSRRPHACMETSRTRTERSCCIRRLAAADRWEKAMSYKTHANGGRKVDTAAQYRGSGRTKAREGQGDRGGKAVDQGECGRAQPVPDAESGERAKRARPCYVKQQKGRSRCSSPPCAHVNVDLLPAATTSPEQACGGRVGRSDVARIWRRTEDRLVDLTYGSIAGLSSETVAKSLDTES